MKFAGRLLIFSLGVFSIVAQTLLFREFICSFESNDLAVAIFFSSWFLWIALAAWLVGRIAKFREFLTRHFFFALLLYLPAFILQFVLMLRIRQLIGLEQYALFPLLKMILWSLPVNAPVGVITGLLFPAACAWFRDHDSGPVSLVYVLEALGSLCGGILVTVLLVYRVMPTTVFGLVLTLLLVAVVYANFAKRSRWALLCLFLPVLLIVAGAFRLDRKLMDSIYQNKWAKILPADAYLGAFQTSQAEYLYGKYGGQWLILREGGVCESFPDPESGLLTAALHLAQHPTARRVLVIGNGMNLCRELLRIPQFEEVSWAFYDPGYLSMINQILPTEMQLRDPRIQLVKQDIREYLKSQRAVYDVVIVDVPLSDSSLGNRFFTREFYSLVKQAMSAEGIMGVRVAGGENFLGRELLLLGASVRISLREVFSKQVIVAGENTWFIAAAHNKITGDPDILQGQFASISKAGELISPASLYMLYEPERAAFAEQKYNQLKFAHERLINRDNRPLAYLFSLLLTAKQSGVDLSRITYYLTKFRGLVILLPFLVMLAIQLLFKLTFSRDQRDLGNFSGFALVFSGGIISIGVMIVLLYLFQTRFGSLYLYLGLLSALFMLGLAGGGIVMRKLKLAGRLKPEQLMFAVFALHILVFAWIGWSDINTWHYSHFMIAFLLPGFCSGVYFPLAAELMAKSGLKAGFTGSRLEMADHLGAAIGAILTGLVLIPLLGTGMTVLSFILLLLCNVPLQIWRLMRLEN